MKWDTGSYDTQHGFVTHYGEDVLALLAPQAGERVLDVGCGTGHLTQQIAEAGAYAVGMDSSPEMIASACAAHPQVKFCVADAAQFSLDDLEEAAPFDAIFSNAALHWVTRMEAAVICMAKVLRSGGRFVAELGGKGNIAQITQAFAEGAREVTGFAPDHGRVYPSIGEYSALLEKHNLMVRDAQLFARPTKLEGAVGMGNWLRQFNRALLEQLPEDKREAVIATTEAKLRGVLFRDGCWFADYVRLRIVAIKE
jgi:trans-aconitate methyltransferase